MITPCRQLGLTLIELTVVLLILVAMAGVVVPYISGTSNMAECAATDATMAVIKSAIVGDFENPGYYDDMNAMPNNLDNLFNKPAGESDFNPVTGKGWRGPYLYQPFLADHADRTGNFSNASYVNPSIADGESVILDGYGLLRPIIIQNPTGDVRLVSSGPDGVLDTAIADTSIGGDDRVLYLKIANPDFQLACKET